MTSLYVYLASMRKEGIKVLAAFPYAKKVYPTRINDIKTLNLAPDMERKVSSESHENRMNYELYVETADTFNSLKEALEKRGYSRLPLGQFAGHTSSGRINHKALVTKEKTMLRKKSSFKL